MTLQEARPLESKEGSGGSTPNPALLGEPRSMRQSTLDDYQYSGKHPWRDEDTLRELYIEKDLTVHQVGDRLGCSGRTISEWLRRKDIETRGWSEAARHGLSRKPAQLETLRDGYEQWANEHNDAKYRCRVHRLLAVSEFGFEAVADMHVHHKNNIPWANWPSNLELLSPSDHMKFHSQDLVWDEGEEAFIPAAGSDGEVAHP